MKKTLGQAKADSSLIKAVTGLPACDPRFLSYLNQAQERLADMGKWWGTYERIKICATGNCVTWPRIVKTIEGLNLCGRGTTIASPWYEFQELVAPPRISDHCGFDEIILDRGTTVQFRDMAVNSKVRLYPADSTDVGKKVILQGLDGNGAVVRTTPSGASQQIEGEQLILVSPFVTSTTTFQVPRLTGVQKPMTSGMVRAYAVNPATGMETHIADWEPSEENPCYRRSFVRLPNCSEGSVSCTDDGDGCMPADLTCGGTVLDAIIRREFIPAVLDTDWLFIGNIRAIKHMMKAIQKEDKNQYGEAREESALAVKALRSELDAYLPVERTVINIQPQGTAHPRRVFGSFI